MMCPSSVSSGDPTIEIRIDRDDTIPVARVTGELNGRSQEEFLDTVVRAKTYLHEHGRVSLRALQREFELDDEALDELVEELVDVQQVAAREGKVLSWIGAARAEASAPEPTTPTPEAASEQIGRAHV